MRISSDRQRAYAGVKALVLPHPIGRLQTNENIYLLMLHGLFGSPRNWRDCATSLSARWQVLVPNLPFFDFAAGPDRLEHLLGYLRELLTSRSQRVAILGNSLGGHLAVHLAMLEPKQVAGLVLTGSSGLYERSLAGMIRRRPPRGWVRDRVREVFYHESHATDGQVEEVMSVINDRKKALAVLLLAKSVRDDSLRNVLRHVPCPVSLIWGANDTITPPQTALDFKSLLPSAELHFIPDCGHAPMMEQPEQFNQLAEVFLRRLGQNAGAEVGLRR